MWRDPLDELIEELERAVPTQGRRDPSTTCPVSRICSGR